MENLNYLKGCLKNKVIPDENKISLSMYCDYFEQEIENHLIEVELSNGEILLVKNKASHVAHIIDLHQFYDPCKKDKKLRFSGSFSTIEGYRNMKKKFITLKTLKEAKKGKIWEDSKTRHRVLCFPYLNQALLYGTWYEFDINKYSGKTNLIPKYIVNYIVQNVQLNFCLDVDSKDSNYYCISNLIAYKKNSRIENQDYADIDRVIEYLSNGTIITCVCRNRLYASRLLSKRNCETITVSKEIHQDLYNKKCYVNSVKNKDGSYDVTYLEMDSNVPKYIKQNHS